MVNSSLNLRFLPADIVRDVDGGWVHPSLPNFEEHKNPVVAQQEWLEQFGLEMYIVALESEEPEISDPYFEEGDINLNRWQPAPPVSAGAGWFLVCIADTDDGPLAWFVRPRMMVDAKS